MNQHGDLRIPVILDTDIGTHVDDTWALAMLLRCPEMDVRLVVSDTGDTEYRARVIARLLEVAGRPDVPVGIGMRQAEETGPPAPWVAGYELSSYPGIVHQDGVQAMIETLEASAQPVTLICIGPMPNIAEVLRKAPHVAESARFVGMHGSLRAHQDGGAGAVAEYNVRRDIRACRAVFNAPWLDRILAPLDTCGQVRLQGPRYAAVAKSRDPLARAVMESERFFRNKSSDLESGILFDTVAVHLAYSTDFLEMEEMGIEVTDEGFTVRNDDKKKIYVALRWTDLEGFKDDLVQRMLGKIQG